MSPKTLRNLLLALVIVVIGILVTVMLVKMSKKLNPPIKEFLTVICFSSLKS